MPDQTQQTHTPQEPSRSIFAALALVFTAIAYGWAIVQGMRMVAHQSLDSKDGNFISGYGLYSWQAAAIFVVIGLVKTRAEDKRVPLAGALCAALALIVLEAHRFSFGHR